MSRPTAIEREWRKALRPIERALRQISSGLRWCQRPWCKHEWGIHVTAKFRLNKKGKRIWPGKITRAVAKCQFCGIRMP
ncbi:hypothetical protein LCGC14_0441140 [marine sediment metagenome]|uniref:Uncharacterized protein n=1 Tax=marine sediment metagenome TaxID=412755 RepID=A0A0F9T3I0_9ZZZZ